MNINNLVEVTINTTNHNQTIRLLKYKNINIYKINYQKNKVIIKIKAKDLDKINKLYEIDNVNYLGIKSIFHNFKKTILNLISITLIITLIVFYTNIIVKIDLTTENTELRKYILNELDKNDLNTYSFVKNDETLLQIKNKIFEASKDKIEWINIERVGMKYLVKIEPKKSKNPQEELKYCHVIAIKDGTISKIISQNGTEITDVNDSVKKGDILISGDIKLNETTKNHVCATGKVYAKTWYTIDVSTTKTYEEKIKKSNFRYNLLLNYKNKSQKIFKSRIKNNIEENNKIIDLFGLKLYVQKEYESEINILKYDTKTLEEKINKIVKEKMLPTIKEDGKIITQKVLKKVENDSTIEMTIFIVVEEQIGLTQEIEEQDIIE